MKVTDTTQTTETPEATETEEKTPIEKPAKRSAEYKLSDYTAEDHSEMARMYEETLKNFTEGSIVTGTILEIRPNEALVDIGYKSEGVIPIGEFEDISQYKIGDELSVLLAEIEDENGMVVLSKQKADEKLKWERVLAEYEEGSIVEGVVKSRVKGGLIVDVDGVEAFLPGSQTDIVAVRDLDTFMGNTYQFKIIKISSERRNIVLSRRELMEEQLNEKKKKLLAEIEVGQRRKGIVKNITDFGAFVDLDGLDGLLHITDMSWGRIRHPSEMVSVGEELEVIILDVDHERERVSLGLKQKSKNPWENIEDKYPVGSRLRAKVVNIVPYGAFVELEEGVEGLVHVSEISWTRRIAKASDVLSVGDEVDVVVIGINKDEQKIALGMRQTEANPWDTVQDRYPVGSRVKGTVRNFTSYGAFVGLEEGIDGMIHVSDMSWTRKVNHPSEVLEKDQEVEAVVLEIDPDAKRISLGLKQAQEDPWNRIVSEYSVGQTVKGKVSKIASFGAFVEVGDGVDGLVHISQLSNDRVEKVGDVVEVGQDVEARIVKIDRAERRIGLTMRDGELTDDVQYEDFVDDVQGLRPGEDMVDLAGAFDKALGGASPESEEWRPGEHGEEESSEEDKT